MARARDEERYLPNFAHQLVIWELSTLGSELSSLRLHALLQVEIQAAGTWRAEEGASRMVWHRRGMRRGPHSGCASSGLAAAASSTCARSGVPAHVAPMARVTSKQVDRRPEHARRHCRQNDDARRGYRQRRMQCTSQAHAGLLIEMFLVT